MADAKLSLNEDAIQSQLKSAVEAALVDARRMTVVAGAIEAGIGELVMDAAADDIRAGGTVLRAQVFGLLIEILGLASAPSVWRRSRTSAMLRRLTNRRTDADISSGHAAAGRSSAKPWR